MYNVHTMKNVLFCTLQDHAVGTFLVCRRKLSELSSKVQIVWEGLKIWKKSPTYFWNDLLSKVKTKWEIFSTFYQNIWTLFKNVCSSQRDEIFSEIVLLFSCISIISLFRYMYNIYSISTVRKICEIYGFKKNFSPIVNCCKAHSDIKCHKTRTKSMNV